MAGKRSEGLMVGARSLRLAEIVCRRIVEGVRIADGAISTVLVKKGERTAPGGRSGGALSSGAAALFIANSSAIHRRLAS